jgi:RNA polymerase sigma-70 factor (ECF subfamily)
MSTKKERVQSDSVAELSPHFGLAFLLAVRVLGNRAAAEDAVQEALMKYVQTPPTALEKAGERSCFLRLVHSVACDLLRSEKARKLREAVIGTDPKKTVEGPEHAALTQEAATAARRELAQLPLELRTAVCLCCEEGFTQREAAEILQVPLGTVARRVQRGLEQLRERMTLLGFAALAPTALAEMLGNQGIPAVPASLADKLGNTGFGARAVSSAGSAMRGGKFVKIGLGIAAAGLVAGTAFWAVGGKSEEPAKPPAAAEKKSKFDTPVWHADAEWEYAGPLIAPPRGQGWTANLDGPAREILSKRGRLAPWASVKGYDPCMFQSYDEATDRYHVVAGSARGYLDGPFSRARYGGHDYGARATSSASPSLSAPLSLSGGSKRFVYITDGHNGCVLRRLDFVKQEVSTVRWEGDPGVGGFTIVRSGELYVLSPPNRLLILSPEGKLMRQMTVELRPDEVIGIGGAWPHSLALDEKRNRLYASGSYLPARAWHIWYWALNDNGKFHGEVAAIKKGAGSGFGGQPGSYKDGWFVYSEGFICWGPDDPDYRFLYTARTDLPNFYRLDLDKKEAWSMNGIGKKEGDRRIKFELDRRQRLSPDVGNVGPLWQENGDFLINIGGAGDGGLVRFKRIK